MAQSNGTSAVDRYRNFDLEAEPQTEAGGPRFTLAGQDFECLPEPPGLIIEEVIASLGNDLSIRTDRAIMFLRGSIVPADRARLEELLRAAVERRDDDGNVIGYTVVGRRQLSVVVGWLIEEYTARPTRPPSG